MSCIALALCCCFKEACQCVCLCCPSCKSSIITRVSYVILLVIGVVIACIFTAPALGEQLLKIESFCNTSALYIPTQPVSGCTKITSSLKEVVGFPAVYRVCLAWGIFFLFMTLLMLGVKSSNDCRAGIQNGFWFFKYLIVIGTAIGAFFIHDPKFEAAMMVIGGIGAFLFYIIQMVLLIDIAYKWTSWWMGKYEETDGQIWFCGVITFATLFYALFVGLVVILYIFYANGDCSLQKFFISFNLILCVALSIVSALPQIQRHNARSGLLQSSIVSLYIMYITWSSLASFSTCNPLNTCNSTTTESQGVPQQCVSTSFSYDVIIPLIIFFFCALYAGFNNGSTGAINTVSGKTDEESSTTPEVTTAESGGKTSDDEEDGCRYNYSFFHFIFLLAILFTMMTITHWISPISKEAGTTAAVWVKIASSWVGLAIYLWTLVAPLVLRGRTFA